MKPGDWIIKVLLDKFGGGLSWYEWKKLNIEKESDIDPLEVHSYLLSKSKEFGLTFNADYTVILGAMVPLILPTKTNEQQTTKKVYNKTPKS